MDVNEILSERQGTHGDYFEHASITQGIKRVMVATQGWGKLDVAQRETLEMIAHKIGRVLAGNPNHQDHWDDISGYSTLISKRLRKEEVYISPIQDEI